MEQKTGIVYYCSVPVQFLGQESSIARKILQRGFTEFFQSDLREEEVERLENGKPYYKGNRNFHFNISHCKGGIAVAVSRVPVGVDVESLRKVNRKTAEKCCGREEISYVFDGYGNAQNLKEGLSDAEGERFLKLWTLKESYVKMTGEGLRRPLDEVCFSLESGEKSKIGSVRQIFGFDPMARHYMYQMGGCILSLTVKWDAEDLEPDFIWKKYDDALDLF